MKFGPSKSIRKRSATPLAAFYRDAAIPALNRAGVDTVGLFRPEEEVGPLYVILRHASAQSLLESTAKLLADTAFLEQGAEVLNAPADKPAYARMESSILLAFTRHPQLAHPSMVPGRVLQLRIYESPSVKTGQKKIEMFNTAEIAIFKKTGLNPVFFGEAIAGGKMPNLTYMLGFDTLEDQKAAWDCFRQDPDWLALRAWPEYNDKAILCGITNILLRPMEGSQI